MTNKTFDECVEEIMTDLCPAFTIAQRVFIRERIYISLHSTLFAKQQATNAKQAEQIGRLRVELKHCEWRKGYTDASSDDPPRKRPVVEKRVLFSDPEEVKETQLVKEGRLSPYYPSSGITTRIIGACPRCHSLKAWGHTVDCKLKAALAEQPGGEGEG